MATIIHFDIGADNPEKTKKFYENIFGWKISLMPGPGNYYMIETRNIRGGAGIGGGLIKNDESRPRGIINYVDVTSLDETLEKIVQYNGKILQAKQLIPGYGYMALCTDPEGNIFGIFEEVVNDETQVASERSK